MVPCAGCGLRTERSDGPTHAYIGASAGCWATYGELLARPVGGQLAVDTYAVQHPGVDGRRSRQSVGVHLVSMCAVLERDLPPEQSVDLIRRAIASRNAWPWLELPAPIGHVTVAEVVRGDRSVDHWSADVWLAWRPHHETVRTWLDLIHHTGATR